MSALLAGELSSSAEPSADVLVHLAGAGMSGGAMLDRDLCERVNVGGAKTCVECCRRLMTAGFWSYRLQASHRLARTIRTHRRRHAAATGRAVCMIYLSTYNVAFSGSIVTDGDEDLGYSRAEDHTDEYSKSKIIAERAVLSANGAIPPRYRAEMCCRDLGVLRRARRRGHDRAPPGCDLRRARESPSATYHAADGVGDVRGCHRRQGRLAGIYDTHQMSS